MKKVITIVSDLHVGSSIGLCPAEGLAMDEGGEYKPSAKQKSVAEAWINFFKLANKIGKRAARRILVVNGDLVDGFHHNTVALATNNIQAQEAGAAAILQRVKQDFDQIYVVRGTEAHTQPGAQSDERIAESIDAVTTDEGKRSWWQLWLDVDGMIFNIAHHVGTTSSAAYESSAPMRELVASLVEAAQWGQQLPDVVVRSHRHRYIRVATPSLRGEIQIVVTPGWQLRTPYIERIDRFRMPHIGGVNFVVENNQCQIYPKIYPMKVQEPVKV